MGLPCGRSAHREEGYEKGQGKKLYMLGDCPQGEIDVMYGFADGLYRYDDIAVLSAELGGVGVGVANE